jgi:hypothetical protein
MFVYICIFIYIFVFIYVHVYTYTYVNIYIYIYIYRSDLNILRGSVDAFIKKVEAKDKERENKWEDNTKILPDETKLKASTLMPLEVQESIDKLQKYVDTLSTKVGDASTALAKMHVRNMYLQDEIKAAATVAKEAQVLATEQGVTLEKLEGGLKGGPALTPPTQATSHSQVCVYVCICIYINYVCVSVCVYTIYVCICSHTYMYIYMLMYT